MQTEQTTSISASDIRNGKAKVLRRRNGTTTKISASVAQKDSVDQVISTISKDAPYGYRANGKPYLRRPSVTIAKRKVSRVAKKTETNEFSGIKKYVTNLVDAQVEIAVNRFLSRAFK